MTTAKDLLQLLAEKHAKDIFVSECKDGPTWFTNCIRIDAWVMKRSWSKPCCIAYEIKTSRSDFLKDDKWPQYLSLCNQFYFVAPPNIIDKAEIPESCGFMVASKNIKRLYTKRKAPYREIDEPASLYKYVLLSRALIEDSENPAIECSRDYWRGWLKEKDEYRLIGRSVSKQLRQDVDEKIRKVEIENTRLKFDNKNLQEVRVELERLGVENNGYSSVHRLEQQIKEAKSAVPHDLPDDLIELGERLKNFIVH